MIATGSRKNSISGNRYTKFVDCSDNEEEDDSIPLAKLLVKRRKRNNPKEEDETREVTSIGSSSYLNSTRNATRVSCQDDSTKAVATEDHGAVRCTVPNEVGRRLRNKGIIIKTANILHYLSCRCIDSTTRYNFIVNTNHIRSWLFLRSTNACHSSGHVARRMDQSNDHDTSSATQISGNQSQMSTRNSSSQAGTVTVTCLSFHIDGTYVAVGHVDGTLRIYACPTTSTSSSLSLLYQEQWKGKPITNVQWNPEQNDDRHQIIAVAFSTTSTNSNRAESLLLIHLDLHATTRTPISTTCTTAIASISIINSLLFLPQSKSIPSCTTSTQLVAGTSTGTICVWTYRYRTTTNSQPQQEQPPTTESTSSLSSYWKLMYNTCTILPRGESILDIKHGIDGIIVIGGKLGSIALVDLWKPHTPIFSSRQRVPTILQQICVPPNHTNIPQYPLQRLYTHVTTPSTNSRDNKNSIPSCLLERITIWALSHQGTVTRIVFQRKRKTTASSSSSNSMNSKLGNTTITKVPPSNQYEPTFTTLPTDAFLSSSTGSSTKHCLVPHCIGDILLLHSPFIPLIFLGQREILEGATPTSSATTKQKGSNRWDPRILSLPTQDNNATSYSITTAFLDSHHQQNTARYGVLYLPQEPRHILVHPTNHSYVMVAYANGSVELISIRPSP